MTDIERIAALRTALQDEGMNAGLASLEAVKILLLADAIAVAMKAKPPRISDEEAMSPGYGS